MKKGDLVRARPDKVHKNYINKHGWLWVVVNPKITRGYIELRSLASGMQGNMWWKYFEEAPNEEG